MASSSGNAFRGRKSPNNIEGNELFQTVNVVVIQLNQNAVVVSGRLVFLQKRVHVLHDGVLTEAEGRGFRQSNIDLSLTSLILLHQPKKHFVTTRSRYSSAARFSTSDDPLIIRPRML